RSTCSSGSGRRAGRCTTSRTRRSSTTSRSSAPRSRSAASTRCGGAGTATGTSTTAPSAHGRQRSPPAGRTRVPPRAPPLRAAAREGCCCTRATRGVRAAQGCASSQTIGTGVRELERGVRGAPVLLLALPLLGVARLLPAYGFGLWLRLLAATLVLLLPGSL